jgi:hypothetical protein
LPSRRAQLDGLLEALDPKLPEDVAVAFVDGEQRTLVVRAFHQRVCDSVVVLHDDAEVPVDMVKAVKGGLRTTSCAQLVAR